jgi:alkanesulfonate monooxygenase SsuD/methylene tetrahydromethanopterin reductase-like flavin-dependent oxidoreductase (luciferase family)
MKIGITLPQMDPDTTKENMLKIALDAEKEGLDSIWVAERLLWPLKP